MRTLESSHPPTWTELALRLACLWRVACEERREDNRRALEPWVKAMQAESNIRPIER